MGNLGELFRQIRLSKNWSIREAARRMGISHTYLSVLEKGEDPRSGRDSNPRPDTLRLISNTYDYPFEELLKAAGYLSDECFTDHKFDLTVFICNMNLIMGNMSVEELSADILDKTGCNISPKQIRSYLNGDIEPYPGTINILSKYAHVTTDFWYVFNTQETLEMERKKYEDTLLKIASEQHNKDFYIFTSLREDIKNWLLKEENHQYLRVAMEAQTKKVNPTSLKLLVETLVNEKIKENL
mgnify:CR=1 FL=1